MCDSTFDVNKSKRFGRIKLSYNPPHGWKKKNAHELGMHFIVLMVKSMLWYCCCCFLFHLLPFRILIFVDLDVINDSVVLNLRAHMNTWTSTNRLTNIIMYVQSLNWIFHCIPRSTYREARKIYIFISFVWSFFVVVCCYVAVCCDVSIWKLRKKKNYVCIPWRYVNIKQSDE